MKIVVTGGAGFIGSHVTELLCNEKHDVVVVDDLSFGYKKFVDKRAKFVNGNIGDYELMTNVLKETDAVIHLAASSIISFSYTEPKLSYQNNLMNGIILLEAMRKTKVRNMIYSSTAAVYGNPKKIPVKESDLKEPLTIYGSSKLAFEDALRTYYYAYGIESVSLRYFNVYGPRDEQQPATRAVPMWIKALITNSPVEMYWSGKQTRDYIYVKDVALAHLAVLNKSGLHQYNIGSGTGVVMQNIIKTLEKISGKKLQAIDKGQRKGDPGKLVADISKIEKEIGWEPKTSLFDGLQETFSYYNSLDK